MRNIIVAYDREHAIGAKGDLLWRPGEMKSDMRHFRDTTMGYPLIMGRKTLESIGVLLPGRETIVCSRAGECEVAGVTDMASSLEEAYRIAEGKGYDDVFVVGGGEIYRQAMADIDRIFATEVEASISGADTYFPEIPLTDWRIADKQDFSADADNKYPYSFVTYERVNR